LENQRQLNSRKNKLKISVTVTLKKDVLDPQGKVILQTLNGMGMENLKNLRQGKYFELELEEENEENAIKQIDDACKKLLVNLIIENYKIDILK
jgi:phosphoribosylformylglycinamidine synthase PurS subunit|tara:strand:- start:110 stop:391 length:282 start_codon:yes stop_codon:yes gene_type:complete